MPISTAGRYEYRGSVKLNAKGTVMFALTTGGDYLVTVTDTKPQETLVPGISGSVGNVISSVVNSTYVVRPNDSLYRIAVRNGMSLKELISKNPQISNPNRIRVGQVINL